VALDVDTPEQALELIKQTRAFVGGFKVGPRLSLRYGEPLLKEIARHGNMFIDNKYFDIPSTMLSSVRASFEMGATYCTVHAQAGSEALKRLADLEAELNRTRPFRLLVVTVLTSFKQETLPPTSQQMPIAEQASQLAKLAIDCGLSGLVCSPDEVSELRQRFPDAFLVTPGVRMRH
jgi:orotidine-5'-phosphate decarboxylase